MCRIHISCLFRLWTGILWLSRPRLLAFRRVCRHGVTTNLTGEEKGTGKKKRKACTFCISSPPCGRVIGLSVLLAAVLQWASSTLQAVRWESRLLCGSSASRTHQCQGDFTHYSAAIWQRALYHMHLTSFKFCLGPQNCGGFCFFTCSGWMVKL